MVAGLTEIGLREKIRRNQFELKEDEAIDMFFIYPTLVSLTWKDGNVTKAKVSGLNLEFSITE